MLVQDQNNVVMSISNRISLLYSLYWSKIPTDMVKFFEIETAIESQ